MNLLHDPEYYAQRLAHDAALRRYQAACRRRRIRSVVPIWTPPQGHELRPLFEAWGAESTKLQLLGMAILRRADA